MHHGHFVHLLLWVMVSIRVLFPECIMDTLCKNCCGSRCSFGSYRISVKGLRVCDVSAPCQVSRPYLVSSVPRDLSEGPQILCCLCVKCLNHRLPQSSAQYIVGASGPRGAGTGRASPPPGMKSPLPRVDRDFCLGGGQAPDALAAVPGYAPYGRCWGPQPPSTCGPS